MRSGLRFTLHAKESALLVAVVERGKLVVTAVVYSIFKRYFRYFVSDNATNCTRENESSLKCREWRASGKWLHKAKYSVQRCEKSRKGKKPREVKSVQHSIAGGVMVWCTNAKRRRFVAFLCAASFAICISRY